MKTFADVKRAMQVGVTVTMTKHDWYPNGTLIGVPRKVQKVQSNAVQFEGGSWLHWPRASDVVPTDKGFTVVLSIEKAQLMEYEIEGLL
jgi:hypothetical protein